MLKRKTFSNKEISEMKQLMQQEKKIPLQRKYHAVYLHMIGKTNKEIAKILSRSENTIGIYLHTFYDHGIQGLVPIKQEGRPRWLTPEQEERLYHVLVERTPHDEGFKHAYNWTAKLAIEWVKENFGIVYANNGMLDIFHRMGLSHTRPTYTLKKADPEKQKAFKEQLSWYKKSSRYGRYHSSI